MAESVALNITVLRGATAESSLKDPAFLADWEALADRCLWTTAFQRPPFVRSWFTTYRSRYELVLAVSRDAGGTLQGLIPLAVNRDDGELVAAGTIQAEYQGWICDIAIAELFPQRAMRALQGLTARAGSLRFNYLPAGVPIGWLSGAPSLQRQWLLEIHPRPLLRLGDGSETEESFNKPGNKNRLRQLKKIGPVEFVRVTNAAEIEACIDDIAAWHDGRNMHLCGIAPFAADPLKKPFHIAMMREPELLHATLLKAGDQLLAAQLNVRHGPRIQLGLIAHNPAFLKHSPGKLHMLFLERLCQQEGFTEIDLTPGGDQYKERFADSHDEVYTLTCFATAGRRRMASFRGSAERALRKILAALNVNPGSVASSIEHVKQLRPRQMVQATIGAVGRLMGRTAPVQAPTKSTPAQPSILPPFSGPRIASTPVGSAARLRIGSSASSAQPMLKRGA